ncbi:MAG: hypothetical protein JST89_14010 [Cyanobacteria bacterium SZAS-4]|nr:hypothetical protein [Cyanobacteria bacterium SZAS-4]
MTVLRALPILSVLLLAAVLPVPATARDNSLPTFKLTIKPLSMEKTVFDIEGDVAITAPSLSFVLMPWHAYKFVHDGNKVEVKDSTKIPFSDHRAANHVQFSGTTEMRGQKCVAADGEIYCLNNSLPNPEVISNGSYYDVSFVLPHGISALAADSEVIQLHGLEFQLAKLSQPIIERLNETRIEFIFPEGFQAKQEYLEYIKECLATDLKQFGKLPFSTIKIGVIRRGGTSEINGNPSGNLILFSRTALGDPVAINSLSQLDIHEDLSDGLRKLIIAHEVAHFWFGSKYLGQDGWMQEGIPQYIGLVAATKGESEQHVKAMLSFFEKKAERVLSGPIPNTKFEEESPGFERDYYQAPLVLYKLGKQMGHDRLITFLVSVYAEKRDPTFADFDRRFVRDFPSYVPLWRKLWKLDS